MKKNELKKHYLNKIKNSLIMLEQSINELFDINIQNVNNIVEIKDSGIIDFYSLKDLRPLTGMSRSSIYLMMQKGTFPKQVHLGERRVAWKKEDIQKWIKNRQ